MQHTPHSHKPDSLAKRSEALRNRLRENRDYRLSLAGCTPEVREAFLASRIALARSGR